MEVVVKISFLTKYTLTRYSGDNIYKEIASFLRRQDEEPERILFDFDGVRDVSISFIQATVLKLHNDGHNVELINVSDAVRFKIASLIRIAKVDPRIFKRADRYPQSPLYI